MSKKKYISQLPCTVCYLEIENMVCFHHVKTRGSGGPEDSWNRMPLCLECHNEVHNCGTYQFSKRYIQVRVWLEENFWEVCELRKKWVHFEIEAA